MHCVQLMGVPALCSHDNPCWRKCAGTLLFLRGDLRPAGVLAPVHRLSQPGHNTILLYLACCQQLPGVLADLCRVVSIFLIFSLITFTIHHKCQNSKGDANFLWYQYYFSTSNVHWVQPLLAERCQNKWFHSAPANYRRSAAPLVVRLKPLP